MNFFPPNRGVDFYFEFLPAKIDESISILNLFPPNRESTITVRRSVVVPPRRPPAITNHQPSPWRTDHTSSHRISIKSATIMAASTIRIITVAIAFASVCRPCSSFTSIGIGLTILQPRVVLPPTQTSSSSHRTRTYAAAASTATGNLHGQGSCFLPLLQNDEDYIAPRIVQVRFFSYHFHLFGVLIGCNTDHEAND